MGCNSCKSDCEDCSGDCKGNCEERQLNYGIDPRREKDDIRDYLRRPPLSVKPDSTPLNEPCKCTGFKVKRYQCRPCIRAFVWGVPYETTELAIEEFKQRGNTITIERLEEELKERKRKEL